MEGVLEAGVTFDKIKPLAGDQAKDRGIASSALTILQERSRGRRILVSN